MENPVLMITLGVLFLAGLAADQLGSMTRLPRVTMLLLLGLGAGEAGFDLIPGEVSQWFDAISIVALTMVAFLLGGALSHDNLSRHGREIMTISIAIVVATLGLVTVALILLGQPPGLALILGAIATATAPAAMADVIRQSGYTNTFTETLRGIVAIDDVWGLLVFSVTLALAGHAAGWGDVVHGAAWDLGGAVVLGIVIGFPAAKLTGRLSPGEPLQAEAIGVVFLTAGLSLWLEVSFLVTGMTVGAVVTNFAHHHERAFHEIENLQWPFMILFFLLAGASLEVEALRLLGWTGVVYMIVRIISRWIGGLLGAWLGGVRGPEKAYFGPALLPQAGVAVGMALVAGDTYPDWAAQIMALTIASTVIFEILGPPVTLAMIRKQAREAKD